MAIIKRRLLARNVIIKAMLDISDGLPSDIRHDQISTDAMIYMLADGDTVKVYLDRNAGGMVVEYDDGL